jgi:sulfonate transport system ATP-binding protein
MSLIDVHVRDKSFGALQVLRDVHFAVRAGERVTIVGPSGCGKSTLLRLIAGLDRDFRGAIHRPESGLGFVFQEPRLMPWLSVRDNVAFGLAPKRFDAAEIAHVLAEVGLADKGALFPKALSGGMAQRAALARALIRKPLALLLDEPFSAVDAFTRLKLQELVLELARIEQLALVIVTHDLEEAVYLGERVLVLGQPGEGIVAELDTQALRERSDVRLAAAKRELFSLLDARERAAA